MQTNLLRLRYYGPFQLMHLFLQKFIYTIRLSFIDNIATNNDC